MVLEISFGIHVTDSMKAFAYKLVIIPKCTILIVTFQAILVFNYIEWSPVTYDDYVYPTWGHAMGWVLAWMSLFCIPFGIIKGIAESPGNTLLQVHSIVGHIYILNLFIFAHVCRVLDAY